MKPKVVTRKMIALKFDDAALLARVQAALTRRIGAPMKPAQVVRVALVALAKQEGVTK